MQGRYLENKRYEVLEYQNGDCVVKDKETGKFYFQKKYFISRKWNFEKEKNICWEWKDTVILLGIVLSVASMINVFFQYNIIYDTRIRFTHIEYFQSLLFIIFNIIAHEAAHYMVMRFFGRKAGKIKLKFYLHIFPCIVTNTSDSYMLPRHRRGFVYYAGIMTNWLICGIVLLLFADYAFLLRGIVWMTIYNMIPFGGIKTDGYHIIVNTILDIRDLKNKKNLVSEITKYVFLCFAAFSIFESIRMMLNI